MSRLNLENCGFASLSGAQTERSRLQAEIDRLQAGGESLVSQRARRIQNEQEDDERESSGGGGSSSSSPSPSRNKYFIEGNHAALGVASSLSEYAREIQKEENEIAREKKHKKDLDRISTQITVSEDRVSFFRDVVLREEKSERETLELLFLSKTVEAERHYRARKMREKVDKEVNEYLEQKQLVDDLQRLNVEDRWITREKVLQEAAENRKAREEVENQFKQERETVFLDESDIFASGRF